MYEAQGKSLNKSSDFLGMIKDLPQEIRSQKPTISSPLEQTRKHIYS